MKFHLRSLLVATLILSSGVFAFGGTITTGFAPMTFGNATLMFDDVTDNGNGTPINTYGGLNWTNGYVLNTAIYETNFGPNGYTNGTVSQPNVAFDGFGDPLTIGNGTTQFIFNNGYITAAWNDGLDIQVDGYLHGVDVISGNFTIDTTGPTFFFATGPVVIDTLVFVSSGGTNAGYNGSGTHFALDNLNVTVVPEPGTLMMLGTGTLGLAGLIRRKLNV